MSTRGTVRTLLVASTAVVAFALFGTPIASADTVSNAVTGLQTNPPLYVGDTTAVISSKSSVVSSLPSFVRIAVLPSGAGNTEAVARSIGAALDPSATQGLVIGVVSGRSFGAASSRYCAGFAAQQATTAVADHKDQLQAGGDHPDLTALITDFGNLVKSGPIANSSACTGSAASGSGAGTDTATKADSGSSNAWAWLVGIFVVLAGGIGGLAFFSRRKKRRLLAEARVAVDPLYDRLAGEVNTIDPKDDAVARQAMADASQRFTSAGSQLHTATSVTQVGAARQTVLQGLYAARTARGALGLDLGPPLESLAGEAEQLNEPRAVTVQGQTYQGQPNYSANSPYYYGGGYGVPGGWYGSPFWETLLLTSVLTGGFGGFGFGGGFGGGGYGTGYDQGYQAGQDNAGNANDAGAGGNWGGGDWGGGGGDWGGGGGGGGGDWGGGGGGDGGASW